MSNRFYVEGEHRSERVHDLFARIASRYDLINDLQSFGLHRAWKRRLVRLADVKPGERALDVCCGTGDIAFALARAGAEVAAIDFTEEMLAVARTRGEKNPQSVPRAPDNPQFQRGDVLSLSFDENTFDIVTVGYGLRNLSSWEQGLREMHRVAKPGGRLLVLDFGKPDSMTWRWLYFAYLRCVVPMFGKLFCGDSATHAYILESLKHYPAQRGVAETMRGLGCRDVRIVNFIGGGMSINYGVKSEK